MATKAMIAKAGRKPKFKASAFPCPDLPSGRWTTEIRPGWRAAQRAAISDVRSVDPSSITRISNLSPG